MQLTDRIAAFSKLGTLFANYCEFANNNPANSPDNEWITKLDAIVLSAKHHNGWFTKENLLYSLDSWAKQLTEENLNRWMGNYDIDRNTEKNIGIIMAGNIPLVGFHDFLSVIMTGNIALVKLSSNDNTLLPFVTSYLTHINDKLVDKIQFADGKLENFDAVIATGSDNTARYFEHYFGAKPNIIRKNRNSVAVLTGKETKEQLEALSEDIFRYYGLGCRSVSKLFVPKGYDFDAFFNGMYNKNKIIEHAKYSNNYDYNKAVYLMSEFNILDNGFLMIKEDNSYASPIATVFYEYYDSNEALENRLKADSEKIQCVVADGFIQNEIAFGNTQCPSLTDYADNVDTVDFLLKT